MRGGKIFAAYFRPEAALAKRVHPHFIIVDQLMGMIDLRLRHFLDHLFLRDRGVWIATNSAERVPKVGACQINPRADADLVVPTDTRLRAGMSFHRRAQIPFKRPDRVLFDAETKRVHHPDQLFSVGIAGPRSRPKRLARFLKFVGFHQIPCLFDIRKGWGREQQKGESKTHGGLLFGALCLGLGMPATAQITLDMFPPIDAAKSKAGQLLFYDPILSGNRNISCGTCHHHDQFSADGVSLGIGEGGVGVGPKRVDGIGADQIKKRVPRHAPALWNVGAHEFRVLFHDGRLSPSDDYDNGINSPAEEFLPEGLDSILAAQALFPMVAQFEMAGNPKENEIAGAVHDRIDKAWPIITARVNAIPAYKEMLGEVTIASIANALGAFMDSEWRTFDSAYDTGEMDAAQRRGAELFFGDAGCATCHSGPFQTDHGFHAIGLPPFGPGRTRQFESIARDVGRMSESDAIEDAYKFRTPSLRNVALTAPYGHNGAYPTLDGIIRHHLNPKQGFDTWTPEFAALPVATKAAVVDFLVWNDSREMTRQKAAVSIEPVNLNDAQIDDLVAFMGALTGGKSRYGRLGRPDTVPSGLKVD